MRWEHWNMGRVLQLAARLLYILPFASEGILFFDNTPTSTNCIKEIYGNDAKGLIYFILLRVPEEFETYTARK
jgi:hypothetical protein